MTLSRRTFLGALAALAAVPAAIWKARKPIVLHTNELVDWRTEGWFAETLASMQRDWYARSRGIVIPDQTRMSPTLYARYERYVLDDAPPNQRFVLSGGVLPFHGRPVILDRRLPGWEYAIDGGYFFS